METGLKTVSLVTDTLGTSVTEIGLVLLISGTDSFLFFSSSLRRSSLFVSSFVFSVSIKAFSEEFSLLSKVLPVGSGFSLFLDLLFCCLLFTISDVGLTLGTESAALDGDFWPECKENGTANVPGLGGVSSV